MSSTVLSQEAKNAQASTNSSAQIMMTLAQLAATAPNERPSGETLDQQQQRILAGINSQLSNSQLPTAGQWQAVWLGLTQDRANLAYIAVNYLQNAFAVSLRGTQFNSLIDLLEDLNVGSVADFTAALQPGSSFSEPILVSLGSMKAFTEITNAVYIPNRTNLLQALAVLIENAPSSPAPTLYITGHSLGGAMATMVALYLNAQTWTNQPAFAVYTFAAPTAGLQGFADYYDSVFPDNSWRYYNVWDLVPNAWVVQNGEGLSYVLNNFYPSVPSSGNPAGVGCPAQGVAIHQLIGQFMNAPGPNNVYAQTNQTNGATPINNSSSYGAAGTYDSNFVTPSTGDFLGQVSFQHNSYLAFLGVPSTVLETMSLPPVVAAGTSITPVNPNSGPSEGGTPVSITGSNFTPDCVVDFGTVPATMVVNLTNTQIIAVAPPGAGTADVRVTNMFGTSAVTAADQYTAPSPVLAPAVMAISPDCGPSGSGEGPYTVTLTGAGFTSNCTVTFGSTQLDAADVVIISPTEIQVIPPSTGTGTVTVAVTSPSSTIGRPQGASFTFGPPVVTGISPTFGLEGSTSKNPSVTITGFGFGNSQGQGQVQFGGKSSPNITSWSDTKIVATPSYFGVMGGAVSQIIAVTVSNSNAPAAFSAATPACQYTYYNSSFLYS